MAWGMLSLCPRFFDLAAMDLRYVLLYILSSLPSDEHLASSFYFFRRRFLADSSQESRPEVLLRSFPTSTRVSKTSRSIARTVAAGRGSTDVACGGSIWVSAGNFPRPQSRPTESASGVETSPLVGGAGCVVRHPQGVSLHQNETSPCFSTG